MKLFKMKGGIYLDERKSADARRVIDIPVRIGDEFYIPFNQHIGAPSVAVVKKGDTVKAGQVIAISADDKLGVDIHSSIDGEVLDVKEIYTPSGFSMGAIIKASEQSGEFLHAENMSVGFSKLIKSGGIVGLGGAGFPAYAKIEAARGKVDTIIINASECEPYLTCDQSLIIDRYKDIVEMIKFLRTELSVDRVVIALEGNTRDGADPLIALAKESNIEVETLRSKYPQGGEKQLIYSILHRVVPMGGLPISVKVLIQNVATIISMYDLIFKHKTYFERRLTVSGNIDKSYNINVKIGTPVKRVFEELKINPDEFTEIVFGGFMTGTSVRGIDTPIVKTTGGILLFKTPLRRKRIMPCIRCGRCISACVMQLSPTELEASVARGDIETAIKFDIMNCIECGCCSYVCISNRALTENIKLGKKEVINMRQTSKDKS